MEKYIAIGDIHGSFRPFLEIMEIIKLKYPYRKLIFLGDYLDRGVQAEKVINYIKNMDAIFLLGNHEEMTISDVCKANNQSDFEKKLMNYRISKESLNWIKNNCISIFETERYIFTHSGLNPSRGIDSQTEEDYLWSTSEEDYSHITSKLVIHGHKAVSDVKIVGNNINIDTGCGKDGPLSAIALPEMDVIQSKSIGVNEEYLALLARIDQGIY